MRYHREADPSNTPQNAPIIQPHKKTDKVIAQVDARFTYILSLLTLNYKEIFGI